MVVTFAFFSLLFAYSSTGLIFNYTVETLLYQTTISTGYTSQLFCRNQPRKCSNEKIDSFLAVSYLKNDLI